MSNWSKILLLAGLVLIGSYLAFGLDDAKETVLIEKVNEAWLRVPLPPMPNISGLSQTAEEKASVASTTFKRELFGINSVEKAVENPTTECQIDDVDPYECYSDYLTYIVERSTIEAAFEKVKALYNSKDSYAVSQCHQLTHVIGRAAATKFPMIAEAYNYGDTFCWSGYYHGVMEAVIAEIGLANVPARLNNICAELPGKDTYSFNYFNCVHGLGHGTMYVSGHELFQALELCDILKDFWEKESCYGGVFMENVIANEIDHVSNYLKPDDLLYPCNSVDDQYKNQCYLMQTSYMLGQTGYDFKKVFEICGTVEDKHRKTCYQSLGRDASGSTSSSVQATKDICLLGPSPEAQENCIVGAVKDFISYFHSDAQGKELCESLPEELTDKCTRTVTSYYSTFKN